MNQETLVSLIPDLTEQDVSDDTGSDTITVSRDQNPNAAEARMFTLEQLNHFFNVKLRRSDVRYRLDENDKATRVLEDKVDVLEKWRIELEDRIAKRIDFVDDSFKNVARRFDATNKNHKELDDLCHVQFKKNDSRYEETQTTFQLNMQERERLAQRQDRQEANLIQTQEDFESRLKDRFERTNELIYNIDKEFQDSLSKVSERLDNVKYELVEVLNQRQEAMHRQF